MTIPHIAPLHGAGFAGQNGTEYWAVWLDDDRLVSGGTHSALRVWNARAGTLATTMPGVTGATSVPAVVLPDRSLVVGQMDGTVRVLESDLATPRWSRAHHGGIRAIRYAAAADLIVTAGDGTIRFIDPLRGTRRRPLLRVGSPMHSLAVTPDLHRIGATHRRGLQVWADRQEIFRLDGLFYHGGKGQGTIAVLGGGRLACVSFRYTPELCVWDLEDTGAPRIAIAALFPADIYTYATSHVPAPQRTLRLGQPAHSFAVAPDERLIALVLREEIALVRCAPLEVVAICLVPLGDRLYRSGPASAPAFSPDGRLLSAVNDGRVWVWDIPQDQDGPMVTRH